MTQIKSIMTVDKVYTTFDKTIHAIDQYVGDTSKEDVYNDQASQQSRSLGFSLACRSPRAWCTVVDWSDRVATVEEIFKYLNECHPNDK